MNLIVDIGNTLIKIGLFSGDKLVKIFYYSFDSIKTVSKLKRRHVKIENIIISDVTDTIKKNKALLSEVPRQILLNHKTPLPFANNYRTPATLGTDRISLVAGAMKFFPGKNVLVISAGTCITYDFINSKKEYRGGSISPGLHMRLAALNHFTARLPLVNPGKISMLTGKTTRDSMLSGVINGIAYEMDGFITDYRKNFHDVKVILSG